MRLGTNCFPVHTGEDCFHEQVLGIIDDRLVAGEKGLMPREKGNCGMMDRVAIEVEVRGCGSSPTPRESHCVYYTPKY